MQVVIISNKSLSSELYISVEDTKYIKLRRSKSLPVEPTLLENINISESLQNTFNSDAFYHANRKLDNDIVLMF